MIDDHPPIKAFTHVLNMAYHGTYTWNILTGCLICLNHKDFTYIQPSNQSYSTQILSCSFQRLGATEKSPFVLLRTLNRCKPLDQARFGRTVKFMDGFHEDFQGIQQFGLHVAPEVTVTGRLRFQQKQLQRYPRDRVRLEERTVRCCQND